MAAAAVADNFLKILYDPADAVIDIVAIHGLNPTNKVNHAEATWTADNGNFWLKDFLPKKPPSSRARILLFGYNSNVAFEASTAGVREHADNLLNRLQLVRTEGALDRPIVFICHSLGGLVVKRALIIAKAVEAYAPIKHATYGIVFFGTPHQGGNHATLGEVAAKIARLAMRSPKNSLLESLKKESVFADALTQDFRHQLEDYFVISFYETMSYKNLGLIVDKNSATLGLATSRETQIALQGHHSDICKFNDIDGEDYQQVEGNILKLLNDAVSAFNGRGRTAVSNVITPESIARNIHDEQKKARERELQKQTDHQRKEILRWLSPLEPEYNLEAATKLREAGTGQWLLNTDRYLQFKQGGIDLLWLNGKAGSGKTVLTSSIIQHLREYCRSQDDQLLAFVFCDFKDDATRNPVYIAGSLCKQLYLSSSESLTRIHPAIQALYEKNQDRQTGITKSPRLDDLIQLILDLVPSGYRAFIVLDALDECDRQTREDLLLPSLLKVASSPAAGKLCILVTSRDELDIRNAFVGKVGITLNTQAVDEDIELYVTSEIQKNARLRGLPQPTRDKISRSLSERADGMFRWAACQLDVLKKARHIRAIEAALRELPKGLYKTYDRILDSIVDDIDAEIARRVLLWLTYSQRPVSLEELVEAIAIDADDVYRDKSKILSKPLDIFEICGGLIVRTITSAGSELGDSTWVGLSHFSVKEYLQSEYLSQYRGSFSLAAERACHKEIVDSCLTYLAFEDFCVKDEVDVSPLVVRPEDYPLLDYAASSWPKHYHHGTAGDEEYAPVERRWLKTLFGAGPADSRGIGGRSEDWSGRRAALHYRGGSVLQNTAALGATGIVRYILENNNAVGVDEQDGKYGCALIAAAYNGYIHIVRQLLDHGANVNCHNDGSSVYDNPLTSAALGGYVDIIQILLDRGANVNKPGSRCGSALMAAAAYGHEDAVRLLLLSKGARTDVPSSSYGLGLEAGDFAEGFDPTKYRESIALYYGSPLSVAALKGHLGIVELLLDAGADIDAGSGDYYSCPLAAAAWGGEFAIARFLLAKGADVNVQNASGGSTLCAAASIGSLEIFRLLIDHGADVQNKIGHLSRSLLEDAAIGGDPEILRIILDTSYPGDQVYHDDIGKALLQAVALGGRQNFIRLLLSHNQEIGLNCQFNNAAALERAIISECAGTLRLLLDSIVGRATNASEYVRIIVLAAQQRETELLRVLLVHVAKTGHISSVLCQRYGAYGNALSAASIACNEKAVRVLVEFGALIDEEIFGEFGVCHEIVIRGQASLLSFLLAQGADPNALNCEGRTPLYYALTERRSQMDACIQVLRDAGGLPDLELNERAQRLRRPICVLSRRALSKLQNGQLLDDGFWRNLASLLRLAGDFDSACGAYQLSRHGTDPHRLQTYCDQCDKIIGCRDVQMVCRVCDNTDLCQPCFDKGSVPEACKTFATFPELGSPTPHEFWEIPPGPKDTLDSPDAGADETLEFSIDWLKRIAELYGDEAE